MTTITRVCSACLEEKPADDFYSRSDRPGQFLSRCKPCYAAYSNVRYLRRKGDRPNKTPSHYYRDRERTEKTCARCGQTFPIETFALRNERTGKRRAHCPPCHNEANLEHKRANPEQVKASNAAYRAVNPKALAERQRKWREEHPQEYRAIHSLWKRRNVAAVRAAGHRRRARELGAIGSWTAAEWEALKTECDYHCLMCGLQEPEVVLTVDHIVPISLGGSNMIDNLQPLCKSCNSKKHTQTLDLRRRSE